MRDYRGRRVNMSGKFFSIKKEKNFSFWKLPFEKKREKKGTNKSSKFTERHKFGIKSQSTCDLRTCWVSNARPDFTGNCTTTTAALLVSFLLFWTRYLFAHQEQFARVLVFYRQPKNNWSSWLKMKSMERALWKLLNVWRINNIKYREESVN